MVVTFLLVVCLVLLATWPVYRSSHIRVPLSEALMNHNWQAIYFEGENTKGLIQSRISLLYFYFIYHSFPFFLFYKTLAFLVQSSDKVSSNRLYTYIGYKQRIEAKWRKGS